MAADGKGNRVDRQDEAKIVTERHDMGPAWRKDIEVGLLSHVGMVRAENQDCWAFFEPETDADLVEKGRILVVCDGMGGHNGGTVASRTTVETMVDSVKGSATTNLKRLLSTAIDKANVSVRSKGMKDPSLRNMGTTCVAVAARGSQIQVAHIGDSRAYLIRGPIIEQITRDHTYLNDLIEIGLLTPEKAKNHPERNIITRCVGMGDVVQVDFTSRTAQPGDIFLLCSDGLYNHVEDDEMREIAESMEAQAAAQALVDMANSRGGEDNITVGILKVLAIPQEFEVANNNRVEEDDTEEGQPTPVLTLGCDDVTPPTRAGALSGTDITTFHTNLDLDEPRSRWVTGWVILIVIQILVLIILQILIANH
jgi:protein phosphatase